MSAIFGAVANFAGSPEEKLKAVIRAGTIAEAFFLGQATEQSRRPTQKYSKKQINGSRFVGRPGTVELQVNVIVSRIEGTGLLLSASAMDRYLRISVARLGEGHETRLRRRSNSLARIRFVGRRSLEAKVI